MLGAILALTCLAWEVPTPSEDDRAAYQLARAKVGRDAEAHVKLALWCEAHGLDAERVEHLAMAVTLDPTNAPARGLLGMVDDGGRWRRPGDLAKRLNGDPARTAILAEYAARRDATPRTADAQWKLALWCEEKGLKDEARAHLTVVVRHDPSREAAWKRLGYKKVDGRWATDEQVAAQKAEVQAQKAADKAWKARLQDLKADLKNPKKRFDAEQALTKISDPRAVPALIREFGGEPRRLIQVLGQIDSLAASRSLAVLSLYAADPDDRRSATETLRHRDPREFAHLLIGMLRESVKYEVRHVGGPGSPGALFVAGERFNVQRLYSPPPMPEIRTYDGEPVWYDGDGFAVIKRFHGPGLDRRSTTRMTRMNPRNFNEFRPTDPVLRGAVEEYRPKVEEELRDIRVRGANNRVAYINNPAYYLENLVGINISDTVITTTPTAIETVIPIGRIEAEHRRAALSAQAQLEDDIATLDQDNADVDRTNSLVIEALRGATGADHGADGEAWKTWYFAQVGYSYTSPARKSVPTVVEDVPLADSPRFVPIYTQTPQAGKAVSTRELSFSTTGDIPSCFGAGTLVHTTAGPRPIESLKVGDRVLAQVEANGALRYQPIITVLHNPPAPTLRVDLGGEPIVSSTFHRFWVAGKGWKMARDLRAGDLVRTLEGTANVNAIEPDRVQPVFNLEIAGDRTFFVGNVAALVHDNTVPDLRAAPFDAAPDLLASKGRQEKTP